MNKPKPITVSYLDYHDVIHYIEGKYNIKTRGYTPKNGFTQEQLDEDREQRGLRFNPNTQKAEIDPNYIPKPHLDFWHQHCDSIAGNGSYLYMGFEGLEDEEERYYEEWYYEILQLIYDEFKEYIDPMYDCLKLWVEW